MKETTLPRPIPILIPLKGSTNQLNRIGSKGNMMTEISEIGDKDKIVIQARTEMHRELRKVQKLIDKGLEKAEDNLWSSNSALYKAKRTNMYSSINGLSNSPFSVLEGIKKNLDEEDHENDLNEMLFPISNPPLSPLNPYIDSHMVRSRTELIFLEWY
jgi:predicted DNA-binding antitoxin AbrB/MazE fold protein